MTDLTTLPFPTATAASPLPSAAPTSVTGVPGMAAQFARTLGDLLGGTSASEAVSPATGTPPSGNTGLPGTALLVGATLPLQPGRLLATGTPDRQTLADDGNAVPADPAFPLLANPTWRANLAAPATPPRTPVSLRTALERAAAQLAAPIGGKIGRGAAATPLADVPAEDADPVCTLFDPEANDPGAASPSPDLPASAPAIPPATLPVPTPAPRTDAGADVDAMTDSSGPVMSSAVVRSAANPAAARPAPTDQRPGGDPASFAPVGAPPTVGQERTAIIPLTATTRPDAPAIAQATALPALAQASHLASPQDAAAPTPPATAPARRLLPSDQAILAALGALPKTAREASPVQGATATGIPALPQARSAEPPAATSDTPQSPAANTPPPRDPAIPAPGPAASATGPSVTATPMRIPATTSAVTTSAVLSGRADSIAPDSPTRTEPVPVRVDRNVAPPIAVSATPQPAAQVFAAARATAASWRDRPAPERPVSVSADPATPAPPLGFASAVDLGSTTPVQPTAAAQRTPLDLTQDSGVQRMIDHIEVLRDDADSRDTRIRLVPDALGSVDVAVRQVGERIHVSFTAEHEATRALIADAQPRLTELAAERGVRIVGTSVATDANSGASQSPAQGQPQAQGQTQSQSQSQPQSQSHPNAPQQPPRAPARPQRDAETPEDQRLA